jgi:lysozyme family protein
LFFFDSVMQAGLVALGLIGIPPQQPASAGAASKFEASVVRVLAVEGGYVEHRVDPGGATKHGITRVRLAQYRGRPVTKREVQALTTTEAVEIYKTVYWDALKADELPSGLDHSLFDFAVHSGVPRAVRALQRALGLPDDGRMGPATLAATRRVDTAVILPRLRADRLAFMSGLPAWRTFGKGWRARMEALETRSSSRPRMEMADAGLAFTATSR